jgi:hypothetical protein
MTQTILDIILVGLRFLDRVSQDKIKKEILGLQTDYAAELSKPYDQIDDARLYSLKLRLDGIVQLYCSAAQGSDASHSSGQTEPHIPLSGAV